MIALKQSRSACVAESSNFEKIAYVPKTDTSKVVQKDAAKWDSNVAE